MWNKISINIYSERSTIVNTQHRNYRKTQLLSTWLENVSDIDNPLSLGISPLTSALLFYFVGLCFTKVYDIFVIKQSLIIV